MTIGVVIVTHNNKDTIVACLTSVMREGITDAVIIDSSSSDKTPNILMQHRYQYAVLPENKGFSHAGNIGASLLATDYILFLNPDAQLLPGAIASLQSACAALPDAGIIGGLLVNKDGIAEKDAFGEEISLLTMLSRHAYTHKNRSLKTISPVAWVSGGALMIKRAVFEAIGGFDEEFFLYWEDIDLCKRVRAQKYGVYINPAARIVHTRGASSTDQRHKTELYDASANRYFQKYYPPSIWHLQLILRKLYRLLRPLAR